MRPLEAWNNEDFEAEYGHVDYKGKSSRHRSRNRNYRLLFPHEGSKRSNSHRRIRTLFQRTREKH